MKFAVIGAGGIGCYYGVKLLESGHEVIFVTRGAHLAAIQANGLQVKHSTVDFNQPVTAIDFEEFLANYRADSFMALLICAKAQGTEEIAQRLQPWMNNLKTLILSLQNGVENEKTLCQYINPRQILGGIARRIGGHIESPGVVTATGIGELIFGAYPSHLANPKPITNIKKLKIVFEAARIPTFIDPNIEKALWKKLVINNGVNPLTTITGLDTRAVSTTIGLSEIVYGLMLETVKAAQLENVPLSRSDADDMYVLVQTFDAIKTSMQVDFEHGRSIELDEIAGVVLKICEKHRIPAPYTHSVYHLLKSKMAENNKAKQA